MRNPISINIIQKINGILHLFVAINAIPVGLMMMIKPDGSLLSMESVVETIPFDSLLIPGIILFIINGLGQAFACYLLFKKHRYSGPTSFSFGCALMIWIIVQVIMLDEINFLHIVLGGIGLIEVVFSVVIFQNMQYTINKNPQAII